MLIGYVELGASPKVVYSWPSQRFMCATSATSTYKLPELYTSMLDCQTLARSIVSNVPYGESPHVCINSGNNDDKVCRRVNCTPPMTTSTYGRISCGQHVLSGRQQGLSSTGMIQRRSTRSSFGLKLTLLPKNFPRDYEHSCSIQWQIITILCGGDSSALPSHLQSTAA